MKITFPLILIVLFGIGSTTQVLAQSAAAKKDALLILDASGSMWGQIDGVNKIVIAKEVVEGLVRSLPAKQRLGLVAYGHRRKGDCSDIETLADVGASRADLIKQIRALSPVGKTPLSKSVEHAAKQLNYTKKSATVILVSDGLETCATDPCALAKLLEEQGLDFTVHVIGFDVTTEERKGLACIAEETGGEFLSADNAEELTNALLQVAISAPVKPTTNDNKPAPLPVALKATILQNGPDIQSKLSWKILSENSDQVLFEEKNTGYAETKLPPGDYVAEAIWAGWRGGETKTGRKKFTVSGVRATIVTVPVDLGIPVSLDAPEQTAEGVAFEVTWSGPDDLGAYVMVTRLDDGPREQIYGSAAQKARDDYARAAGDEATLDTDGDGDFDQDDKAKVFVGGPSEAGDYEVRYVLANPRLILARKPITVTDSGYTVAAAEEIRISSKFDVTWTGPITEGDFVTIVTAGAKQVFQNGYTARLKKGVPAKLTAPALPGKYEVRYILANGYTLYPNMQHVVQAAVPVTLIAVEAKVSGPTTAVGGSTITVEIAPPDDWKDDYLSVVTPRNNKPNRDSRVTLNKGKSPGNAIDIRVPAIAGDYEIAYFLYPGNRVLARQPIAISPAQATVDAPASVKAGESFTVSYSGDAFRGDRVIVCPANTPDHKMWGWGANYGFFVNKDQSSGTVNGQKAITKAGQYEARYVTGLQHVILARDKFVVTE